MQSLRNAGTTPYGFRNAVPADVGGMRDALPVSAVTYRYDRVDGSALKYQMNESHVMARVVEE